MFEEVFIRVGLPYKVVGGVRFYERREVQDVLAYLRVIANPDDVVSLRRILNTPAPRHRRPGRGVRGGAGRAGADPVRRRRCERADEAPGIAPRSAAAIKDFVALLDRAARGRDRRGQRAGRACWRRSSTAPATCAELEASDDPQDESRLENLGELVSVAREFEQTRGDAGATLADFLEQVALVADADAIPDADGTAAWSR